MERTILPGKTGRWTDRHGAGISVHVRIFVPCCLIRKLDGTVAVLLSLPVAALGAYLGVWGCGLENDVYFQIGLVMLVGLAAKNAILIVEFAKEQVDKGVDVVQAALHASQLRFRPILMTSLAFILGMLPMVIASGPGSASRQAIGTGVFFGMIFAVTVGILLVPFFFVLIYKMKAKMKQK